MEWTNDMALKLIAQYEKFPMLWDNKHPAHFSRNQKVDAWETISKNMNVDVLQVKQKMNSLLGSFRREKSKGRRSIVSGKIIAGRKQIYVSKWFAFKRMQYLLDKDASRTTVYTDLVNNEDEDNDFQSEQDPLIEDDQSSDQCSNSVQSIHQKRQQSGTNDDTILSEAYNIFKQSATTKVLLHDDCAIYSQHVANKLRKYSDRIRAQVEHAINNILYEADMGKYDSPFPTSTPQYFQNPTPTSQYSSVVTSQYSYDHLHGDYPIKISPVPSPIPSHESSTSSISNCPTHTIN